MLASIKQWYIKMPPITRALVTLSVAVTLGPALGLVKSSTVVLDWRALSRGELWRLVTPFFVQRLGLGTLLGTYYLYRHSLELEKDSPTPEEYGQYYLVTGLLQLVAARLLGLTVLTQSLTMSVASLWGRHYRLRKVPFVLGLQVEAQYLPWVLFASDLFTSGFSLASLVGIGSCHAYFYLQHLPRDGGWERVRLLWHARSRFLARSLARSLESLQPPPPTHPRHSPSNPSPRLSLSL
ncbi:Der1-like family-domain-containing protein [Spinellus fusiger]|nr:Der1-like family-domain-containing protein [Spinellus fusiger]